MNKSSVIFMNMVLAAIMLCISGCSTFQPEEKAMREENLSTVVAQSSSVPEPSKYNLDSVPDRVVDAAEKISDKLAELSDDAGHAEMALAAAAAAEEFRALITDNLHHPAANRYLRGYLAKLERFRQRKQLLAGVVEGWERLEQAKVSDGDESVIAAAENLVSASDDLLANPDLFSRAELADIRAGIRNPAERTMIGTKVEAAYAGYHQLYQTARTAQEAVELCRKAAVAIDQALNRPDIFEFDERSQLAGIQDKFNAAGFKTQAEFDALLEQATELLNKQRRDFTNKRAVQDLAAAAALFKKEDDKWFCNFGGCREDTESLIRAALHCQRVRYSSASWHLRNQASSLYGKIDSHLWRKSEKRQLASRPALPQYNRIPGWPNWKPEDYANKKWLEKRKPAELPDIKPEKKFIDVNVDGYIDASSAFKRSPPRPDSRGAG